MSDAASQEDAARKDAALRITIPSDLTGCHALIEQLACTVDSQTATIEQLCREKQEIELAFAELMQRAFRNRSERYINNPDQLRLDLVPFPKRSTQFRINRSLTVAARKSDFRWATHHQYWQCLNGNGTR